MKITEKNIRDEIRKILLSEDYGVLMDQEKSYEESDEKELGMSINQLQTISNTAHELIELIRHLNYVPEWGESKISTTLDRLNSLRSYMVGKSIGRE